jgi:hypothetical protein
MDPKARAIIREMKRQLAQMRQLKLQLARLRLTTADLADLVFPRKGRRS